MKNKPAIKVAESQLMVARGQNCLQHVQKLNKKSDRMKILIYFPKKTYRPKKDILNRQFGILQNIQLRSQYGPLTVLIPTKLRRTTHLVLDWGKQEMNIEF
jgi:hypothetical protein